MAGVVPMSWFAVSAEFQVDSRNPTGKDLAKLYSDFLPFYGNLIYRHDYALENSTLANAPKLASTSRNATLANSSSANATS